MKKNIKIALFKIISISLPIIVLLFIELILRLFQVVPSLDLFVKVPEDQNYIVLNPNFSKRYFSETKNATCGYYEPFKKEKDKNTIRIFVQGASTAVGFPYFNNGSFHRMLKYRLEQAYPNKKNEIINLSLTAVNSYTLLDQAKEILKQSPDAILIYAGHNEYYGALGVASTNAVFQSPRMKRLLIKLNKIHLIQFIKAIKNKPKTELNTQAQQNLMEEMAGQRMIKKDSEKFTEGIKQFEQNMDLLLKIYSANNIPVFISTIASNEKSLKPFVSSTQLKEDSARIENLLQSAIDKLELKDTVSAQEEIEKALAIDSTYAKSNFLLGQLLLARNENKKAKEYFVKAKDFDGLRFRAPEEINQIIKTLAAKYQDELVDAKAMLEDSSENNILGYEFMLEHVHPNLDGYFLIAEAFYRTLKEKDIFGQVVHDTEFKEFQKEMPLTIVDSLMGAYTIQVMRESWPFNEPYKDDIFGETKSKQEEIAGMLTINQITWDEAMEELYRFYQSNNDLLNAIKVAEATVLEHPLNDVLAAKAGQLISKNGDYEKALFYYKKSFDINRSPSLARRIAQNLIQLGKLEEAKQYLNFSFEQDRTDQVSEKAITAINTILDIEKEEIDSFRTEQSYIILSMNYLKLGNKEMAYKNFLKAKSISPENLMIKDMEENVFSNFVESDIK